MHETWWERSIKRDTRTCKDRYCYWKSTGIGILIIVCSLWETRSVKMVLNSTADVANTLRNHSNAVDTFAIVNCALNVVLVPVAIVGNALVLGAIIRTTSLHSPSMVFIGNLAITDLLVGLMIQPLYSTSILLTDVPILKTVVEITAYPMCGVSLCTLTVISVDRFMALHYHMQYSNLLTTSRAVHIAVIIFCIIYLASAILYFLNKIVFLFVAALVICLCFLTSIVSYIQIYRIVRRHKHQIHAQQLVVQGTNASTNWSLMIQLKKSALNTFMFYIVTILCYIPVVVSLCVYSWSFNNWTKSWNFADTLAFMNSSLNPFLFCWRLNGLRSAVVNMARQKLCCWQFSYNYCRTSGNFWTMLLKPV